MDGIEVHFFLPSLAISCLVATVGLFVGWLIGRRLGQWHLRHIERRIRRRNVRPRGPGGKFKK